MGVNNNGLLQPISEDCCADLGKIAQRDRWVIGALSADNIKKNWRAWWARVASKAGRHTGTGGDRGTNQDYGGHSPPHYTRRRVEQTRTLLHDATWNGTESSHSQPAS